MLATETSAIALTADNPIILAQLEYQIDYNEAAKTVVSTAIGMIPYVGAPLGALVTIFWPSTERDVWAEIEGRVEALIDQKISELVWQQTVQALDGLQNVLDDYLYALEHYQDDPAVISQKWNSANSHFLHDLPAFQAKGYELLLLPLFAQFGNMHLFLLRDGIKFGANWGWSPSVVAGTTKINGETITKYSTYAQGVYDKGLADLTAKYPNWQSNYYYFNQVNPFRREMQLTVLDFVMTWPYFDTVKYPNPVEIPVTREIYSDAVGRSVDSTFSLPAKPPTQAIKKIIVWGWDRIDAAQVDYPTGGGPDGITSTGRMGNTSGGSDHAPWGGTFEIPQTGPVVKVKTLTGDILNAMWLTFENGVTSQQLGGKYPGGGPSEFLYPGEILSSIKIMGISKFYKSADCAVFGFEYKGQRFPVADPQAMRALYVSDPGKRQAKDFAAALGLAEEDQAELARWARDYGWDTLREVASDARKQRLEAREAEAEPA